MGQRPHFLWEPTETEMNELSKGKALPGSPPHWHRETTPGSPRLPSPPSGPVGYGWAVGPAEADTSAPSSQTGLLELGSFLPPEAWYPH